MQGFQVRLTVRRAVSAPLAGRLARITQPREFVKAPNYFGPAPREIRNRQNVWQANTTVAGSAA